MKKDFIYATMSAIALVGAVSLTSCSSNEDVADVNPTFDGKAVKAQFTISFPQNVAKTRQTANTVQEGANGGVIEISAFRGMDNIVLYPFAAAGTEGQDPVTNSLTKLGDQIELKSMIKPETDATINNSIPAATLMANSNSVLYNDVTIPIGTGSFLFYGKAIDNGTDKFYNGSLTMNNTTTSTQSPVAINPSNIAFDLEQIYPSSTTASTVGAALATYLTSIAKAGSFDESTHQSTWEATTNTGLKDLYDKFITLKAGSSLTVQAAVQDLYTSIKNNTDAVSTAIVTAITNNIYVSSTEGGVLTFTAALGNTAATYFPGDVNLPDGAAYLNYDDDTNTFSQSVDGNGNTGNNAKYSDYVYPASLYYYCNSGVKTATTSQRSLYNGTNTWTQITGNEAFTGNSVGPSTRSVAIIDPIQYAVGRLDMRVNALPYDPDPQDVSKMIMYDKKGEAYDAQKGFDVTGILIGGQKQVKFDFTTNTSATEYTIYDNITKSQSGSTLTVTPTAASATNYTLALETAGSNDEVVNVAVEFKNNGADFEGRDGVIPAGCKFYLVGQLKPSNVGQDKNPSGLTKVFIQDYKTIANFTISKGNSGQENNDGLGAAYNTIPDLRTPQLELGLSVDLQWQSGIEFNVTF